MHHQFMQLMAQGSSGETIPGEYANLLVYPLTYDLADQNGANALASTHPQIPGIMPNGLETHGGYSLRSNTSLPAWLSDTAAAMSLFARVTPHMISRGNVDLVLGLGPNGTFYSKASIEIVHETLSARPQLRLRTWVSTTETARLLGMANWKYAAKWPVSEITVGGFRARPQAPAFYDADTLLMVGHHEDNETRILKVRISDNVVLDSFTFGTTTYGHCGTMAKRGDGTWWIVDYQTDTVLEVDLDASFASGTAVIDSTVGFTDLGTNVLSAIEFVTVSGTEYVLIGTYVVGAAWLYAFPASELVDGTAVLQSDRHKRFVLPRECQGFAIRPADGFLYSTHNGTSSTNDSPVYVYDIATDIAGTADGAVATEIRRHKGAGKYPEGIAWHPVTGEAWMGTEGVDAVDDQEGWLGFWRSPLVDDLPVEHEIMVEYNGAGQYSIYLEGLFFDSYSRTPNNTVGGIFISRYPSSTESWGSHNAVVTISNVAFKDAPFSEAELVKLRAGTYEPLTLTTYTVPLVNPGAETGDLTGWFTEGGGPLVGTGPTPRYKPGETNTYFFYGGAVDNSYLRQRFEIETVTGLTGAEIDALIAAGNMWAEVVWWNRNFNGTSDPSACGIRFRSAALADLGYSSATLASEGLNLGWFRRSWSREAIATARHIDLIQHFDRTSGTNNDGYHDDLELKIYTRE